MISTRWVTATWCCVNLKVTTLPVNFLVSCGLSSGLPKFESPEKRVMLAMAVVGGITILFAIIGYFFQLYFDFSGYADIALGIARLFGIRLPVNFDSPLRATGIVDFYRRWHITLTRVIARFLFTPLSLWGTRFAIDLGYRGWRRRALGAWLPFLVNFEVIALWHGAKTTFMLFGAVHGVWYVIETEVRLSKAFKAFRNRTSDRMRMLGGMAVTCIPLMLTFALFRCASLGMFGNLLAGLRAFGTADAVTAPVTRQDWALLGAAALAVYLLPNAYDMLRRYRPGILTFANASTTPAFLRSVWRPNLAWAMFTVVLAGLVFTRLNRPTVFLYAGF